jgi:hypothetical protein
MASNINPYNVDGTFPIAGQDNSSQGFRDNFTNIKNNLIFAASEIGDLQAKAIVATPLNNQTFSNDMAGTRITRPQLNAWTQSLLDFGPVAAGAITINFNQANFWKFTTAFPNNNTAVTLTGWPVGGTGTSLGYGSIRIWAEIADAAHTIRFDPTQVSVNDNTLANYNSATGIIAFDAVGSYLFDVASVDGGTTYIITDITRNRARFTDSNFYYNILNNPSMYLGFGGGSINSSNTRLTGYFDTGLKTMQSALAVKANTRVRDTLLTFGPMNSVSVGNLWAANISLGEMNNGKIAGYSVTAARGNLLLGNLTQVQDKDPLGRFNAVAFTGNGGGTTFQQVSSIEFFASGSDLSNGIGGNIGFFTATDGGSTNGVVRQAMSIDNDQTVKSVGTFQTMGGIVESGTVVFPMTTNASGLDNTPTAYAPSGIVNILPGPQFPYISNISTVVIDSVDAGGNYNQSYYSIGSVVTYANITLPPFPKDGQTFTITSIPTITIANIVTIPSTATGGVAPSVRYLSQNHFSSQGNISAKLTYSSRFNTWYLTNGGRHPALS